MKLLVGTTNGRVPFISVDSTDNVTRLTSLSNLAASYSLAGSSSTQMTTPTVYGADSILMPGVWWLDVDEPNMTDITLDEETLTIHITADSMAPVTLALEVSKISEREVYDQVTAIGTTVSNINSNIDVAISTRASATDYTPSRAISLDYLDQNISLIGTTVSDNSTDINTLLTRITNQRATNLDYLDQLLSLVGTTVASNATDINTLLTRLTSQRATNLDYLDVAVSSISPPSAASIADAVYDEATAGHTVSNTFGEVLHVIYGLSHVNFVLDNTTFNSSGLMLSGRYRVFADAAAATAATDGGTGEGEIYSFTVTATAESTANRIALYRVVKD